MKLFTTMKLSGVLILVSCAVCIAVAELLEDQPESSGLAKTQYNSEGSSLQKQGAETQSGGSSKHDTESSQKGRTSEDLHKVTQSEKKGRKSKNENSDSHQSSKKASGASHHGLTDSSAKKQHKANFLKGYREKFHKDELNKHDSFFSNGEKSGEYEVYGKQNSKYATDSFSKQDKRKSKKGGLAKSGGKSVKSARGHAVSKHKGHKSKGGEETGHKRGHKHGIKHSKGSGKQYQQVKSL